MHRRHRCRTVVPALLAGVLLVGRALAAPGAAEGDRVDFNRDVRPILSDACFTCHGPDANTRKADLRLDTRDGATRDLGGYRAIEPGDPARSEVYKRLTTTERSEVMPPRKTGKTLKPQQVEVIKRWIEQKADYSAHWSLVPPKRPPLPAVRDAAWAKNPIDLFVLARLEAEGLRPTPEADKRTLVRRVTLDLTGLPPTVEEVEAFLADDRPGAYERLVDRLLASPHYGERMAVEWLDAARFADTHGFHIDAGRDMTAWREWVIDAFNANLPFDRFTIEQLAGDLLPDANDRTRIASGFNRNNMITFEGGAIPEEFQAAYVMDRVDTTATVWLGLSMQCARCHDHKYDPITMKDYYSFYAFFHNVPENPIDGHKGNAAPFIRTPTKQQEATISALKAKLADAEAKLAGPMPEVDAAQARWERTALERGATPTWRVARSVEARAAGGAAFKPLDDGSLLATGANPGSDVYTFTVTPDAARLTGLRVEALPDDSLNARGPGRSENGNFVLTGVKVLAGGKPVKLASASASFSQEGFPAAGLVGGKGDKGWAIYPKAGQAHHLTLAFAEPVEGSSAVTLVLEFKSPYGRHQMGRVRLSTTDAADPHGASKLPQAVAAALKLDPAQRTDGQKAAIRAYYRAEVSEATKAVRAELAAVRKQLAEAEASVRTTMVMSDARPRETFILMRGQYDKKGEKVTANTPASLPPLKVEGRAPNRLDLARWLTDPQHPLVARVTVNRYWQMYFGVGLVKTAEDFGSQGEWPSHPELLDYLARDFVDSGWDVKRMQRLIVTSATYRQSARAGSEAYARDPENRLLARGARFRLAAEFIRDQALAVSGLLNREIGGRSVNPYQPAGLWEELMSREDGAKWTAQVFVQDKGPDLYRRSMYTFWKRTSPPPALATFDAPDRETCTVRRLRTNTPLQALVLWNDPTYVEASRKLAERMMRDAGPDPAGRLAFAFQLATAREPADRELAVLKRVFEARLAAYRKDPAAARKLLSVGDSPADPKLDPAELAACAVAASTILNLDEVITRN